MSHETVIHVVSKMAVSNKTSTESLQFLANERHGVTLCQLLAIMYVYLSFETNLYECVSGPLICIWKVSI